MWSCVKENTDSGPLVVLEAEAEDWSPSLQLLKYSSDSPRACLLIVIHGAGERSEKGEEKRGVGVRREEEKLGRWAMLPVCMSANSQTWSARREGKKQEKKEREVRREGCLNSLWLKSQNGPRKKAKARQRERRRKEGRGRLRGSNHSFTSSSAITCPSELHSRLIKSPSCNCQIL